MIGQLVTTVTAITSLNKLAEVSSLQWLHVQSSHYNYKCEYQKVSMTTEEDHDIWLKAPEKSKRVLAMNVNLRQ